MTVRKTPKRRSKKDVQKFECTFCGKEFVRENSLLNHACRNKIRFFDKDLPHARIAFHAYSTFYRVAQNQLKPKTVDEFIKSNYYLDFIKFGRYIVDNNIMYPEIFTEFCIRKNVPLRDWCNSSVYEVYLRHLTKNEEPENGIERTIMLMKQWSDETGYNYNDFFRKIESTRFVNYIRQGRISPWLLYNSDSGMHFLQNNLNEEQINMISDWIDPDYWRKKFTINKKDREYFKKLFKKEGL